MYNTTRTGYLLFIKQRNRQSFAVIHVSKSLINTRHRDANIAKLSSRWCLSLLLKTRANATERVNDGESICFEGYIQYISDVE